METQIIEKDWYEISRFFDKQKEASKLAWQYKYLLYGGSAGPGKSYWLRWFALEYLLTIAQKFKIKNVRAGLFCEDYPALQDRHLSKIEFEFPQWLGTLNKTAKEFQLFNKYGGGTLCFRNLDDASKYQSSEFACIAVDELTKNEKRVFDFLRTRLRWGDLELVRFVAATNPGSIGHGWVKKLWFDKQFEPDEQEAVQFNFLKALPTDNPHLTESYYKQLRGLPEALRRAFLEGDWSVFEGQVFTEFSSEKHVLKEQPIIPNEWRKFICCDYGYVAPSAVYWCAITNDDKVIVYREFYGTGRRPEELAEIIMKESGTEHIDYFVGDPSMWSKTGHTGRSIAETMEDFWRANKWYLPTMKGDNERLHGLQQVHEFLADASDKQPWLLISPNCVNLIRTLPMLVYDENKKEDIDTDSEDHCYDSIRYGLMSRPKRPKAYIGISQNEFTTPLDKRISPTIKNDGIIASELIFEKEETSIAIE